MGRKSDARINQIKQEAEYRWVSGWPTMVYEHRLGHVVDGPYDNLGLIIDLIEAKGWRLEQSAISGNRWIGIFRRLLV